MKEIAEPFEVRRRREVLAEIEELKADTANLNRRKEVFAQEFFISVDGHRQLRLEHIAGRGAIDAEELALKQEEDKLIARLNVLLAEHAALKPGR